MIIETNKSVFETGAECIVNTVNCEGFMGKGLALEFALRYPKLDEIYQKQCKAKELSVGHVYFYDINGQKIINFPTKDSWKNPSKLEWIEQGLKDFLLNFRHWDIKSIAFPILGGSNGGLNKDIVVNLIRHYLGQIDLKVFICHATEIGDIEKSLIEYFKTLNYENMMFDIKLTKKQSELLLENQNHIKKLSDIRNIRGIGKEAYKKIYNYLNHPNDDNADTISLF